jgi:VanZ family protein
MTPQSVIPRWVRAWWPALIWAAIMFGASTDRLSAEHTSRFIEPVLRWLFPTASAETIILMHESVRKMAHVCEYSIFFLLVFRAIRLGRGGWNWSWGWTAWCVVAVYSLSDEFHQTFVPSRGASIWDSMLDSVSALATLLVLYFIYRRRSADVHS